MITIRFLPADAMWRGEPGVDLPTAASEVDLILDLPCGGRSDCGRCKVRVASGMVAATADDKAILTAEQLAEGWRLACRAQVDADAAVEVPDLTQVHTKTFGPEQVADREWEPVVTPSAGPAHGVAIDVGTTTLACALVDMHTGAVLGTTSQINPQVTLGADIMSRISAARDSPNAARLLHEKVVAAVSVMLRQLYAAAQIDEQSVGHAIVVGNPTMTHTFAGADVATLGEAPYEGVLTDGWRGSAAAAGLPLPAAAEVWVLPGIRSHVGADTVASIIAADLDRAEQLELLIDLGTNSEIVLGSRERIWVTSASGGPAFEGAGIAQGMRATPGAIDQLRIDDDGRMRVHTIGRAPALGLCGSGLLDSVAELLKAGILDESGRMKSPSELETLPDPLVRRICPTTAGRAVLLARDQRPVYITAVDVRQVQLVKASIAAALQMLMSEAQVGVEAIGAVLVSGAFGTFIRRESALAIGLLPDLPLERIRLVGHGAGHGARKILLDAGARRRAQQVARTAHYVDLAGRTDYQRYFIESIPLRPLSSRANHA